MVNADSIARASGYIRIKIKQTPLLCRGDTAKRATHVKLKMGLN